MEYWHKAGTLLSVKSTMKKHPYIVLLVAALAAGSMFAADKKDKPSNVTVTFKDSDKFTDARSSMGSGTDEYYLDTIRDHLQQTASRYLAAGQKLDITVTDIDLAGEILPGSPDLNQVRIVKEVYIPRGVLTFKLTDADGKVVKEGERKINDMNFMNNMSVVGRNDPLFYDRAMLTRWVETEFKH